jgi:hypothetical protein
MHFPSQLPRRLMQKKSLRPINYLYSGFESHSRHGRLRCLYVRAVYLLPKGLTAGPKSPTDCLQDFEMVAVSGPNS